MSDHLQDLYQELIVDHGRRPRNCCEPDHYDYRAAGYNPLCGDEVTMYLQIKDNIVTAVNFTGKGCAISMASASLLSEQLKGKTIVEAETIFQAFHRLLTDPNANETNELGKLSALAGVKAYPMRVKCATLAWHTFHNALHGDATPTTTE